MLLITFTGDLEHPAHRHQISRVKGNAPHGMRELLFWVPFLYLVILPLFHFFSSTPYGYGCGTSALSVLNGIPRGRSLVKDVGVRTLVCSIVFVLCYRHLSHTPCVSPILPLSFSPRDPPTNLTTEVPSLPGWPGERNPLSYPPLGCC